MKKILYTLALILIFASQGTCQIVSSEEISVEKVFGGYNFIQNGKKLTVKELVSTMKPYEEAYLQMKSARTNYHLATAAGMAGGFIIGWQLGNATNNKSVKWEMLALGGGITLMSIPLIKESMKQALNSVNIYNSNLNSDSGTSSIQPNLELTANCHGVALGLQISF